MGLNNMKVSWKYICGEQIGDSGRMGDKRKCVHMGKNSWDNGRIRALLRVKTFLVTYRTRR